MSKTFEYTVRTSPGDLLRILREKLEGHNDISLVGNESSGQLEGKGFEATYSMSVSPAGTKVVLVITQKPFFAPWALIESKLNEEAEKW